MNRQQEPVVLQEGTEIFFNDVDGIFVKEILEEGYTDEELKRFLPTSPNYWLDVINRAANDKNLL